MTWSTLWCTKLNVTCCVEHDMEHDTHGIVDAVSATIYAGLYIGYVDSTQIYYFSAMVYSQ
jgi:hypothetical protein